MVLSLTFVYIDTVSKFSQEKRSGYWPFKQRCSRGGRVLAYPPGNRWGHEGSESQGKPLLALTFATADVPAN